MFLLRCFGGPADNRVNRRSPPTGAVDVATAAAVAATADDVSDAITTPGGGAASAKVAADDADRVVIGNTKGGRMREGSGVLFCLCGLVIVGVGYRSYKKKINYYY